MLKSSANDVGYLPTICIDFIAAQMRPHFCARLTARAVYE